MQTIAEAASRLRTGELSAVELVEDALDRIQSQDASLGAFVTVLADRAREAALTAERALRRGVHAGPLQGIPYSVKDVIDVQGLPTTAGSASRVSRVAASDATVVQRLEKTGAILLGKTKAFEFGMHRDSLAYGATCNPWDLQRSTLGSSSGSAAAMAAGMGLASFGTDTGGSVRAPAAACGVTGYMPSFGRVSRSGVVPLSWSLDHVGIFARTVSDCALIVREIEGVDHRDPSTRRRPPVRATDGDEEAVGIRIGVPTDTFFDAAPAEFLAAFEEAVATFQRAGASIRAVEIPFVDDAIAVYWLIVAAEAYSVHGEALERYGDEIGPETRSRLVTGRLISAADYIRAQRVRTALCDAFRAIMTSVDVVVGLTLTRVPPLVTEDPPMPLGIRRVFNVVGAPALTVPCGFSSEGLPIGLHIAGAPGEDDRVLQAGALYQKLTSWHLATPKSLGAAL